MGFWDLAEVLARLVHESRDRVEPSPELLRPVREVRSQKEGNETGADVLAVESHGARPQTPPLEIEELRLRKAREPEGVEVSRLRECFELQPHQLGVEIGKPEDASGDVRAGEASEHRVSSGKPPGRRLHRVETEPSANGLPLQ